MLQRTRCLFHENYSASRASVLAPILTPPLPPSQRGTHLFEVLDASARSGALEGEQHCFFLLHQVVRNERLVRCGERVQPAQRVGVQANGRRWKEWSDVQVVSRRLSCCCSALPFHHQTRGDFSDDLREPCGLRNAGCMSEQSASLQNFSSPATR